MFPYVQPKLQKRSYYLATIYRLEWLVSKLQTKLVRLLQVARNLLQTNGAHLEAQKTAQGK